MKSKLLLPVIILFGSLCFQAQNGLSNLSFETWSTTAFGATPEGWMSVNASKQTSGAQDGNNYVRLFNTTNNQGSIMLGTAQTATSKVGVPYTQNPISVSGFFKTSGLVTGDVVGLTAFTTLLGMGHSVATFSQTTNVANWTSFAATFSLFTSGGCDSLFMIASSANIFTSTNNSTGAVLDLDNLSLVTTVGVDEKSLGTEFLVFPNPASSELIILSKDESADLVRIFDMNGKLIKEQKLEPGKTSIDLQEIKRGIYFYKLLSKERTELFHSKLLVE